MEFCGSGRDAIAAARYLPQLDDGLPISVAIGKALEDVHGVSMPTLVDQLVLAQSVLAGFRQRLDDMELRKQQALYGKRLPGWKIRRGAKRLIIVSPAWSRGAGLDRVLAAAWSRGLLAGREHLKSLFLATDEVGYAGHVAR